MFPDDGSVEWPKNPAVDNEEAIRRAAQVVFILNNWADVWLAVEDGNLQVADALEKFNEVILPIGIAYGIEFYIGEDFMSQVGDAYEKLLADLARTENNFKEN